MALLLLLKPHPRRVGKGQKLVIQSASPAIEPIAEELPMVAAVSAVAEQRQPEISQEILSGLAKLGLKEAVKNKPLMKELEKSYQQAKAEGVSLEEMVLLYMMTES